MVEYDPYSETIMTNPYLVNLGGIGRLIAATPNDWVNILAVHRFARVFGRGGVYQVPPRKGKEAQDNAHRHLHGRWLFGEGLNHIELSRRIAEGAVIKNTPITEEFDYESFVEHYEEQAIPLFIVTESKRLTVIPAQQSIEPKPGDTLICLVDEMADSEPE